jgi:hypothetical protein
VDEAERQRLLAKAAVDTAELLANVRRERDCRRAAGEDTAWLDKVLSDLEPLAGQARDLEVFQAIRAVVERHGTGPYPVEDLAAIAGADPGDMRRLLSQMVTEGLAEPGRRR